MAPSDCQPVELRLRRRRPARAKPIVALAAVILAALFLARGAVASALTPASSGCPGDDQSTTVRASEVHLSLTAAEHRQWVVFPARFGPDALFILCVDGKQWDVAPREVADGVAVFDISTRWVLAQWFAGTLAHYENPAVWWLFEMFCPADAPTVNVGEGRTFTKCQTLAD